MKTTLASIRCLALVPRLLMVTMQTMEWRTPGGMIEKWKTALVMARVTLWDVVLIPRRSRFTSLETGSNWVHLSSLRRLQDSIANLYIHAGEAFRDIKGKFYPAVFMNTREVGVSISANFLDNPTWEFDAKRPQWSLFRSPDRQSSKTASPPQSPTLGRSSKPTKMSH